MMDERLNYRVHVERAADRRDKEPVYVANVEEAKVVLEMMLRKATKHVNILTFGFPKGIYEDDAIVDLMRLKLTTRTLEIRLLVGAVPGSVLENTSLIRRFGSDKRFDWRMIPSELNQYIGFHFMEMDGNSFFRLPDKHQYSGAALFGDEEKATAYKGIFEDVWDRSSKPSNNSQGLDLQKSAHG